MPTSSTGGRSWSPATGISSNPSAHLCESLGAELKRSVILDGEIVCLDGDGKSLFYDLLFRRGHPRFVAFDLLQCDGLDLTYSPLVERTQRLRAILSKNSQSVLYCDHIEASGREFFAFACKRNLEGIVAKHKFGPYLEDSAQWFKIRNRKVFAVGRSGEVLRR